mmetsp:Transcript_107831/g.202582  ORF Transcript_107831/g.202582 Transcript_107831/m.202582 type:complete len:259 (-) Transcript_107831:302-1078(-)
MVADAHSAMMCCADRTIREKCNRATSSLNPTMQCASAFNRIIQRWTNLRNRASSTLRRFSKPGGKARRTASTPSGCASTLPNARATCAKGLAPLSASILYVFSGTLTPVRIFNCPWAAPFRMIAMLWTFGHASSISLSAKLPRPINGSPRISDCIPRASYTLIFSSRVRSAASPEIGIRKDSPIFAFPPLASTTFVWTPSEPSSESQHTSTYGCNVGFFLKSPVVKSPSRYSGALSPSTESTSTSNCQDGDKASTGAN